MTEQNSAPTPTDREEAREYAVQRLGIVSAVIWVSSSEAICVVVRPFT